jgi:hypothetical protein
MTRWARLTWQAADPETLAGDLGRRLGMTPSRLAGPPPWFAIRLGDADLELVPWHPEGPDDRPQAGGRLVLEPIPGGSADGPDRAADAPGERLETGMPRVLLVLAGIAWATVELDRAAAELAPWLIPPQRRTAEYRSDEPGPDRTPHGQPPVDPHLGALTRVLGSRGLPGEVVVLAEPATEGVVAGSLARHGEGPFAIYLRASAGLDDWVAAARSRGVTVSPRLRGPLGPSVLIPGRGTGRDAITAPQIIIVDAPSDGSASTPGVTINP